MARRQAVRRSKPPTPGWVWLLGGAVIGALLAVVIMLTGGLPGEQDEWSGPKPNARRQADDAPPSPSDESPPKREYDFYNVLPEMEVVIPQQELRERADKGDPVAEEPGAGYLLQAGSFQNHADADRLKAELALQGFVADIQSVTINGDTWHRVRLGPFDSAQAADRTRQRLDDIGVRTIALKVSK